MQQLLLTLDSPAANLALDEALLDWAEAAGPDTEILRLWESAATAVILGRSSRIEEEVDQSACKAAGVAILRRPSGGASVVIGPGCLMVSVVLSYAQRAHIRAVDRAHTEVLERNLAALRPLAPHAQRAGLSDLAVPQRPPDTLSRGQPPSQSPLVKFSGNSLRCKRTHLLYHGTLLYDFDLPLVGRVLRMPPRQPEYREARSHGAFVVNLPATRNELQRRLIDAWDAHRVMETWPQQAAADLLAAKYSRDEWNLRL